MYGLKMCDERLFLALWQVADPLDGSSLVTVEYVLNHVLNHVLNRVVLALIGAMLLPGSVHFLG